MIFRSFFTKIASFAAVALCAGALNLAVATSADAQSHRGGYRGGGGFAGRTMSAPRSFAGPRSFTGPRTYAGVRTQAWSPRHHRRHRHWHGGGYWGGYWGAPFYGSGFYDPYYYGAPAYYERCVLRKRWVQRHHRWVKRWVRVCYY